MPSRTYDLEDRLIDFAIEVLRISEKLPGDMGAVTLAKQLVRSGTSPALNYGEAQSAESPRDFLHKLKVCLKELRETQICLKIIQRKPYLKLELIQGVVEECNQLVAIFTKSIETAKRNTSTRKGG